MATKPEHKISAVMVIHNEEHIIERALKSIKGVADEILILHDGPCKDNSLKICKRYTKHVFENKKNAGVPGLILPQLFRKVKHPWILKIDADEVLSTELQKAIPKLVKDNKADAYTVRWPFTNKNQQEITKNWPRKMPLYRKSNMSYFGFPHWDEPKIYGNIIETNYVLHHYPAGGSIPTLKLFFKKTLGRYARLHATYTLKPFKSFDQFQYQGTDFPFYLKLRRDHPLLTMFPLAIAAFLKNFFISGAWKEGLPALLETMQDLIYYPYVNYLILKEKLQNST